MKLLTELRGAWEAISKTDAVKMVPKKEVTSANEIAYMEKV